jgi:hypothetical protein
MSKTSSISPGDVGEWAMMVSNIGKPAAELDRSTPMTAVSPTNHPTSAGLIGGGG